MRFEWDKRKNRLNCIKHGISFAAAAQVFADPLAIVRFDARVDDEERWQIIGVSAGVSVVLVACTVAEEEGDEIIRIISARKATPRERKAYAESHKKDA
jgi:hypothetical protein